MRTDNHNTKSHQINVLIEGHSKQRTRAKARIRWAGTDLVGLGFARRDPTDKSVSRIGDQLAVARALSDLANQLYAMTSADIQASTDEPATALRH